ncbi:ATP-binding protein [Azohydromonas caseinilytica]|uniref:histidine kinase n=1 Tax=Azohydromonas caseinilytica TaxID=2728836 RepID=A0A848FC33_9BURK|nr:ATP-binding protein [Azohydromonas caseinilytica]NML16878.1 two-component sensor histidine kinase [Azohydromonas caseinilytica]
MSPMRAQLPRSLRARLLWMLLAAILLTALAQGVVAYGTARDEADQIFDYHMQQMALALRPGLTARGLPEAAEAENFDFVVQVWTADGLRVFQSARRAQLPQRAVLGFSDVEAHGSTYRVFSLQTRTQVIQVAQDMAARRAMARALALRTVAPIGVLAPLLMLVAWAVVSSSLAPVQRLQRQVASRQADDLGEVREQALPEEIQPLVDELNLLFARVRQAFEAQKSFVADAAHELRSPLAALKLQVQGLQRASDAPTRERAIQRLAAGIDRATRLVEQLLVLARHQSGAAAAAPAQPVALAEVARLAVADAMPQAQARGIDLGVPQADAGETEGHPEALRILMRNLLDNALKYTPAGGTVDLSVKRDGVALVLAVEDSGPGIPEAERARVFDRFHRVPGSEGPGSGLGLAIVKAIAEMHGAALRLEQSPRLGGLRVEVVFQAGG